jgi:DNA-binding NarL/FixJ family response regulator
MTERDRPVRILVVDDHELFRKGVRALVSTHPEIEVWERPPTASAPCRRCAGWARTSS